MKNGNGPIRDNGKWIMIHKSLYGLIVTICVVVLCGSIIYSFIAMPNEFRKGAYPRLEQIRIETREAIVNSEMDKREILQSIDKLRESIIPSAFKGGLTGQSSQKRHR